MCVYMQNALPILYKRDYKLTPFRSRPFGGVPPPMMDETQARKVLADATAPPMPGQLVDPPEVARYAQRGDPPISEWPGRAVTELSLKVRDFLRNDVSPILIPS